MSINDYPIGTKYPSIHGGYWIKISNNRFKWSEGTGDVFSNIGNDWNGKVIIPDINWINKHVEFITGDLFCDESDAFVNTVNCVGVMGKGIALEFKNRFPNNYNIYRSICQRKKFNIGQLIVTNDKFNDRNITIINFPTKTHWRLKSNYNYITYGLISLKELIEDRNIKSIAIPALGCTNGGLDWDIVKVLIIDKLTGLDCKIHLYNPI